MRNEGGEMSSPIYVTIPETWKSGYDVTASLMSRVLSDAFWEATAYGHRRNDPSTPQVSGPKRRDRARRTLEIMAVIEFERWLAGGAKW
jgi:hypothetical protein